MNTGIMQEGESGEDVITITRVQNRDDFTVEEIPVAKESGGHGGGDKRMFAHLFEDGVSAPLNQAADSHAGAMICLIGIAANRSAEENRPVSIDEFV